MNSGARPERIQYLDVLRVLSMLSVVFLHTAAGTLRTYYGSAVWHFANVVTSFMSAAIPLFFLISGALLLASPKTASLEYTLKRRLPRVLVPFLLWSLLAVAYYLLVSWKVNGTPDWAAAIDKLKHLPAKPTSIHLWFMYALIPLYILSPLIKKLIDALDRNLGIYLLAIWLFFSSVLPTVAAFLPESYRPILVLDTKYNLSVMAGYAGYFVAGYYLMRLNRTVSKRLLALVVVADTVCIALGTWWETTSLGKYAEVFKTYTGVFVVVLSCALFLLAKELMRERRLGRVAGGVVGYAAPLAFGIYLAHNLVVDLVSRLTGWFPERSVGMLLLAYLVVLGITAAGIWVVSAIKPLCYVLTGQKYRGVLRR